MIESIENVLKILHRLSQITIDFEILLCKRMDDGMQDMFTHAYSYSCIYILTLCLEDSLTGFPL